MEQRPQPDAESHQMDSDDHGTRDAALTPQVIAQGLDREITTTAVVATIHQRMR